MNFISKFSGIRKSAPPGIHTMEVEMTVTSRRAVLAGAAALPALTLPTIASEPDPILAAIERHGKLSKEQLSLWIDLDKAEGKIRGHRPIALIRWRDYDIGGSEIDFRRETLLREGKLKPKTIEREYLQAKAEERELKDAAIEWDKNHGLHEKRQRRETLKNEVDSADEVLAKVTPTTLAGAVALLEYVLADGALRENEPLDWHIAALENVAKSLLDVGA